MAAMVAYNLMLALFPFALLLLFIAGQLLQSADVQATILNDLQELFPSTEQDTLRGRADRVQDSSTEIGIVAIVAGLWIGASFWGAMDTAFCRIYHVACRGWLEQKRFSLIMLVVVAFFLTASVVAPGAREPRDRRRRRPAVRARRHRLARQRLFLIVGGLLISFLILCLIYWAVPKGHLPWRGVWPGALFVTVAVGIANVVFPIYLVNLSGDRRVRPDRLASCSSPLIWFYALALGLLAGAVINALRYELHDTGTVRGMTADFEAPTQPLPEKYEAEPKTEPSPN